MNWRIKNAPKAAARNGRMSPRRVFVRFMLLMSTNSGMNVTKPGIIIVASITASSTRLPGNSSSASA